MECQDPLAYVLRFLDCALSLDRTACLTHAILAALLALRVSQGRSAALICVPSGIVFRYSVPMRIDAVHCY